MEKFFLIKLKNLLKVYLKNLKEYPLSRLFLLGGNTDICQRYIKTNINFFMSSYYFKDKQYCLYIIGGRESVLGFDREDNNILFLYEWWRRKDLSEIIDSINLLNMKVIGEDAFVPSFFKDCLKGNEEKEDDSFLNQNRFELLDFSR